MEKRWGGREGQKRMEGGVPAEDGKRGRGRGRLELSAPLIYCSFDATVAF